MQWCTQHIHSVLSYGTSVHLNTYAKDFMVNDKTVYSAILVHNKENTVPDWLLLLAVYFNNILCELWILSKVILDSLKA